MSASSDLQKNVAGFLNRPGTLSVNLPIVRRREKEVVSDLEANDAVQSGLCVFVMPCVATSALQDVPFLFFDGFEVRVRLIELPEMNSAGVDVYQLEDEVALALHWAPIQQLEVSPDDPAVRALGAMLAHPLAIGRRPVDRTEGKLTAPGFANDGKFIRISDVIFNAVLQVNNPA